MIQQIDAPLREDVRLLGNLLGETLKQQAGQDLFNQIFPRLVPALFTAGIFWLLGRKGMTSTKAILVIVVFALAMAFFGILGV